ASFGLAWRYSRICLRSLSALWTPALEVGPLIPGVRLLRLSPWLCWVPSGSRDQNTRAKGLLDSLNSGRIALVVASAKYCCWTLWGSRVPGVGLSPEKPLESWEVLEAPLLRSGAVMETPAAIIRCWRAGSRGMPPVLPVESSMTMVWGTGTAPPERLPWVTSW